MSEVNETNNRQNAYNAFLDQMREDGSENMMFLSLIHI